MRRNTIFLILSSLILSILWISVSTDSIAKIYKYKNKDGKIVYSDTPPNRAEKIEQIKNTVASKNTSTDIVEQLNNKLRPKTDIEKASLCVVTVKSTLGHGSGFFITGNGYILTNKHVIRMTDAAEKKRYAFHEDAASKIEHYQQQLNDEKKRLDNYKKRVDEQKKYLDSIQNPRRKRFVQKDYNHALDQYQSWLKRYQQRANTFKEQLDAYEVQKNANDLTVSLASLDRYFTIILADNSEHHAYLVATSPAHDLALLKLNGYTTPFLKPANRAFLQTGMPVFAVGNPATLHSSVSKGIISGWEDGFIKTDAKIYPGNSGGPLLTKTGAVAGINTFKQLTHKFEGLGFALPIDLALTAFRSHLK